MVFIAATFALLCLARVPAVLGHARVSSPPIRQPGNNFLQTCGQSSFNSVKGDPTGHIEEQEPVNAGCDLTLCRGMPFSDQPASNVQTVKPSQAMAMNIDCTVPHGGPANVSLVDTTVGGNSGAILGGFLATFDDFCPTTGPAPASQTNLQYTLPNAATIGNKCQQAGDCVVQLFWATPDFSQNYYYCVDVVMAAAAPPPPPATTAVVNPPTVAAPPATIARPPTTAPASVPTPAGVNMGAPIAAAPSAPVKMVTSAAAANAPAATNGTVFNAANANAGRRRARILWF